MDLRLTIEQQLLRDEVRRFASEEISPCVAQMEKDEQFPSSLVKKMGDRGWLGIPIPKRWGGLGSDFISYIIAIHEISKASAAVGVILSVHSSVCTLPILHYGTQQQQESYLNRLAGGSWLGAFALTEPQAGSDAAAIQTKAVRDGQDYVLNGTKLFITNAGAAQLYLTFAVTDPSEGARGITAFLVEDGFSGLTIGKKERKMGLNGSNTCELVYQDLRLTPSQRLGEEGQGFAIAKGSLDGGRIGIAAQALGIAEAALELIQQRFRGKAIRSASARQAQGELAELAAIAEAAKLLVYRAASMRQEGIRCTKESSMAKLYASDAAVRIAGAAVRMLGMDGCLEITGAERLFRDAKVTQIYEGTNEIHRIVISGQLLRS
ncbi:acyl-CoA dehydrogenase family protein [Paenibacillus radicis (ex Gao et al. 2016)]|uniref:Acyl-CoA dehydrogenase n=1 Tax=Paenibacillus radicis (ex Gao et al. 2016) TaxID=1737354 RepID=A0A917M1M6_9BACL|nr:acyl-CoA dehydrogenase family protein [Paenibacillus radicis (ex Gao et al. 2016)]GGG70826.1 acyl-CoA dehydrogenase [Paenibacillus radicis (ex Gao et al. 2016)]